MREPKLFSPVTYKQLTLKNRIVVSPMCMYIAEEKDGKVTPFHITHYESRAVGQAGLVFTEASAVTPNGRISDQDLGIWNDEQIEGLQHLSERIKAHGAASGIQLGHAGRKSKSQQEIVAPSASAFDEASPVPKALTLDEIQQVVDAFRQAARRARLAGFDVIEIHAAHGYLLNQFLSPLANKRIDEYGGARKNRYRIVREVLDAVNEEWNGPLFVRISADEYSEEGNTLNDFIYFAIEMKRQGVDLIDCSAGGVIPAAPPKVFPGYQVLLAEKIRKHAFVDTGAVGLISHGLQAEEIVQNERADLVFIGRAMLRNPYWPKEAAAALGYELEAPVPYQRGWN